MPAYLPGRFTAADALALHRQTVTLTEDGDDDQTTTYADAKVLGTDGLVVSLAIDVPGKYGTESRIQNVFLTDVCEVANVRDAGPLGRPTEAGE